MRTIVCDFFINEIAESRMMSTICSLCLSIEEISCNDNANIFDNIYFRQKWLIII